jgi:hypothetical protein
MIRLNGIHRSLWSRLVGRRKFRRREGLRWGSSRSCRLSLSEDLIPETAGKTGCPTPDGWVPFLYATVTAALRYTSWIVFSSAIPSFMGR